MLISASKSHPYALLVTYLDLEERSGKKLKDSNNFIFSAKKIEEKLN